MLETVWKNYLEKTDAKHKLFCLINEWLDNLGKDHLLVHIKLTHINLFQGNIEVSLYDIIRYLRY